MNSGLSISYPSKIYRLVRLENIERDIFMTFGFNELPRYFLSFQISRFCPISLKIWLWIYHLLNGLAREIQSDTQYSNADKRYLKIFSSTEYTVSPGAPGGELVAGTNVGYLLFWPKMFPRCWFLPLSLRKGNVLGWITVTSCPAPAAWRWPTALPSPHLTGQTNTSALLFTQELSRQRYIYCKTTINIEDVPGILLLKYHQACSIV